MRGATDGIKCTERINGKDLLREGLGMSRVVNRMASISSEPAGILAQSILILQGNNFPNLKRP
ncbi:hypothetical protein I79_007054 [Cricetulus griseus]|uniref:Uncharacterized protein n=1 Tax=Cricetulus griseus TaxID=10029 RepID=G3H9I1_CRIGR|nr:hypothetical protein I79_007054 [Cricetulus griseus]